MLQSISRKNVKYLIFFCLSFYSYCSFGQIIADHTVVDKYADIPQTYINEVKKMLVDIAGESHSSGYRIGENLLEILDSRFQVLTYDGTPPTYSDQYLRLGKHSTVGEAHFYTTQSAIDNYKLMITSQNNTGNPFSVMGFGWCWDMTWQNGPGGGLDPVYNVRWAGSSEGGPQGNLRWGLDSEDQALTGNTICMDTYLAAVEQYIQYCISNGYATKMIFTTGPVDGNSGTENGFQREIKHDYIRNYVAANNSRILFDYADILCWNNSGVKYSTNWNDAGTLRSHANIHPDNMMDYDASWNLVAHTEDGDHIGEVGALRLAKAMWWMLARIAGWDGGITSIPVTGITVSGAGGANTITTDNGSLQLTATLAPADASNKNVTWSLQNGTGQASISTSGLVTALANGTVTARATANDGSAVYGTLLITISNQTISVTGINVTGAGGVNAISSDNGTLQLGAVITPDDASDKTVTWSVQNGTGQASISTSGLITAIANGTVTARAKANDGSGVYGTLTITISNQVIPITDILVTGAGGSSIITTNDGTLQLNATISPDNATDKTVTWSVQNGTGQASISTSGLVTALANGTVTARATANDGSGVYGTLTITISNQVIPVTGISVTGAGGSSIITTSDGTLQLTATISPDNATDKSVTWSVQDGTGQATISTSGLVTALADGTVTARATANDGSAVYGTLLITISNQTIYVTDINVTGAGGANTISSDNGTLQLSAAITPDNPSDKTVTWSVQNGTGQASISTSGLVTAIANGTVTARATANDGSGVYGTLDITISNQVIPVTGISVTGAGGSSIITTNDGTLQLNAAITPENATDKTVTWSVQNGTGQASISTSGLVTAIAPGTVTARATANDGSGIYGELTITINNQIIPVAVITVTGEGGSTSITTDNGSLQLSVTITPDNASDKTITWSVQNGTGQASISTSGLVTAIANGTVTARATANDGSGVYGTLTITISNQVIPVTGISVTGAGGSSIITTNDGTLQLNATITPDNATDKTVTWSVQNGTGQASISTSGLVTAIAQGTVVARATANDGSGIYGELTITINNQVIPVTVITVTGEGGSTSITTDGGTLQFSATITPDNATDKTISWSVQNGTGQATISTSGIVTAIANGTVTAKATANDGSGIYGELTITISNQIIPVTAITVTGEGGLTSIITDDGTLQLNAVVKPENATNKTVTWSLQNGDGVIATINSSGLLTAITNGLVTAQATAQDGSGISGVLNVTIENQNPPNGINDPDARSFDITISHSRIVIHMHDDQKFQHIFLYNMQGSLILGKKITGNDHYIDLTNLIPGAYIILLSGSETNESVKFSVPLK